MADIPKGLRTATRYRRVAFWAAASLTVMTGAFCWYEVVNDSPSAPRAFVMSCAIVAWMAWVALCAAIIVVQAVIKRIESVKRQIIAAICDRRLAPLADLMEDDNVRWINRKW